MNIILSEECNEKIPVNKVKSETCSPILVALLGKPEALDLLVISISTEGKKRQQWYDNKEEQAHADDKSNVCYN